MRLEWADYVCFHYITTVHTYIFNCIQAQTHTWTTSFHKTLLKWNLHFILCTIIYCWIRIHWSYNAHTWTCFLINKTHKTKLQIHKNQNLTEKSSSLIKCDVHSHLIAISHIKWLAFGVLCAHINKSIKEITIRLPRINCKNYVHKSSNDSAIVINKVVKLTNIRFVCDVQIHYFNMMNVFTNQILWPQAINISIQPFILKFPHRYERREKKSLFFFAIQKVRHLFDLWWPFRSGVCVYRQWISLVCCTISLYIVMWNSAWFRCMKMANPICHTRYFSFDFHVSLSLSISFWIVSLSKQNKKSLHILNFTVYPYEKTTAESWTVETVRKKTAHEKMYETDRKQWVLNCSKNSIPKRTWNVHSCRKSEQMLELK